MGVLQINPGSDQGPEHGPTVKETLPDHLTLPGLVNGEFSKSQEQIHEEVSPFGGATNRVPENEEGG